MIDPNARASVPNDVLWSELVELGERYDVTILGREGGFYGILLKDYELPPELYVVQVNGGQPAKPGCVDMLLRISESYPHAAPDMFWVNPAVVLAKTNGRPGAADSIENYHGKQWQRFSWHIVGAKWRPIADTLAGTFLPFIEHRLWRGA